MLENRTRFCFVFCACCRLYKFFNNDNSSNSNNGGRSIIATDDTKVESIIYNDCLPGVFIWTRFAALLLYFWEILFGFHFEWSAFDLAECLLYTRLFALWAYISPCIYFEIVQAHVKSIYFHISELQTAHVASRNRYRITAVKNTAHLGNAIL